MAIDLRTRMLTGPHDMQTQLGNMVYKKSLIVITCTGCSYKASDFARKDGTPGRSAMRGFEKHKDMIAVAFRAEPAHSPQLLAYAETPRTTRDLWLYHVNDPLPAYLAAKRLRAGGTFTELVESQRQELIGFLAANVEWTTSWAQYLMMSPWLMVRVVKSKTGVPRGVSLIRYGQRAEDLQMVAHREIEKDRISGFDVVELTEDADFGVVAPAPEFMHFVEQAVSRYQAANSVESILDGIRQLDQILSGMEVLQQLREDLERKMDI